MTDLQGITQSLRPTVRAYLEDSYFANLSSSVVRTVLDEKRYWYIVLDETIFHPKGGGQPSDRGLIEGRGFKFEVKKAMLTNEIIVHWGRAVEGNPTDSPVTSRLDWEWRFLMMRRHSSGHLLDHCLEQVVGSKVETLDSWLGDPCYVAYKGEPPTPAQLEVVQTLENQIISHGAVVKTEDIAVDELKQSFNDSLNFEKLPNLERLRLVTIEGCRPIACGGTHLRNLAEARGIRLEKTEKTEEGFRVYYDVV